MKPAPDDLEQRRPVWQALSDMFLDTDTSLTRNWRVKVLASSPYSVEELERILADEIYPVCRTNLMCVAGEWIAFDPDWLESRILQTVGPRRRWFRFPNFGRLAALLSGEWRSTKRGIHQVRSGRL
jgi:hypothetical protein